MRVQFLKQFSKDLESINQTRDKNAIDDVIQVVKESNSLSEIPGVKKLAGYTDAYRIRSGDYRIGVFLDQDTVQFARVAHRKDIYRIFP